MNKPLFGMLLGGFLGIFDGLSALVSAPETRPEIVGIVIGSTIKGLIAGLIIGFIARKARSMTVAVVGGLIVGLFFAGLVAVMQHGHYVEIMLPGAIVGTIVGFATQKYAGTREAAG